MTMNKEKFIKMLEESDEYNSYIEFSNSVYDNILNKMQEITGDDK